ncbi:MAG TPA: response regulator [Anaeromyxobacteraceae bacterium]|nr:response regulator [Anaeromyxobacteraceae bacterium]
MKILLADDDRLVRAIVSDLLAELGHEVVQAENGQQALELSQSAQPDLMILDFLMPKLSGIDALRQLRAAGHRTPAIILTAITDGSVRGVDGAEAADGFLEKPVTRRALERALARLGSAR